MVIEKEVIVNKSIDDSWQVLGKEFTQVQKWASAINHSEGNGGDFNGASCTERSCSTSMGELKEKILSYSDNDYALSYEVAQGMPSMVKYATNSWQLISIGQEQSKLRMKMNIEVGGVMGKLMQPMMKMQMSKMGNELVEEFKYYVEQGHPHPRKLKAAKKFNS